MNILHTPTALLCWKQMVGRVSKDKKTAACMLIKKKFKREMLEYKI